MAKSAKPTRVAVETNIGRVVFRAKPNGAFIVRCKGQERIRIREDRNRPGRWEADGKCFNKDFVETIITGRTPEQAYKRAIKTFWF